MWAKLQHAHSAAGFLRRHVYMLHVYILTCTQKIYVCVCIHMHDTHTYIHVYIHTYGRMKLPSA